MMCMNLTLIWKEFVLLPNCFKESLELFELGCFLSKFSLPKLLYNDCNSHYIGQAGRRLIKCIHEHQLAVRRYDENSLNSQHMSRLNHSFNWEVVSILDQDKSNMLDREFPEA
uniref:Uncharacterized protein n=1 Tax=Micrurus spixii TaxID=129469 RepID=A0A2D4LEE4_9SAUR